MISKLEMIFYNEILKIPKTMITQYFSPYDRLINLFLVPTVSSIILFYMASNVVFGDKYKGLKFLTTLTAMIVSINAGMYKVIVGLGEIWFLLFIITGAVLFILSMFPIKTIGNTMSSLRSSSRKSVEIRLAELEREISNLDNKISAKEAQIARAYESRSYATATRLAKEVEKLRKKKLKLEKEKDLLEIRLGR